jgi:hypothetical protein
MGNSQSGKVFSIATQNIGDAPMAKFKKTAIKQKLLKVCSELSDLDEYLDHCESMVEECRQKLRTHNHQLFYVANNHLPGRAFATLEKSKLTGIAEALDDLLDAKRRGMDEVKRVKHVAISSATDENCPDSDEPASEHLESNARVQR